MSVLRGGYYYSGGADYAIADAVAGLDHGVNRFLFGIRVRLVQDRVMLGGVEVLALFAELLDTELLEALSILVATALNESSISLCSRMRSISSRAGSSAVSTSMMPCWRKRSCSFCVRLR